MCIHSMEKTLLIKVESFSDAVDSRFNEVKTSLNRGAWISGEKNLKVRIRYNILNFPALFSALAGEQ